MKLNHLLSEYQFGIIKTEYENEKFLEIVEVLLSRPQLTPEENAVLELLVRLIEDFEDKHYQLNSSTPHSRFLHLMEAQSLIQDDLVKILGDDEVVSKVMNGQLELTEEQAKALAKFFNVDGSLFILE